MKNENTCLIQITTNVRITKKEKTIFEPLYQPLQSILNSNLTFGDCVTVQTHS